MKESSTIILTKKEFGAKMKIRKGGGLRIRMLTEVHGNGRH